MKKFITLYKDKKLFCWIGIIILTVLEPTFGIVAVGLGSYEMIQLYKNLGKKIDKKGWNKKIDSMSKDWDKKTDTMSKGWDKKLTSIGKDWKKNPKKAIIPVLGVIIVAGFVNNFFSSSNPKNFKSPAGHTFKEVSNCIAFYREVFKATGRMAPKNKEYVNAHRKYMDFQEKTLNKLLSEKYRNKNAYQILQEVKNSKDFSHYEKEAVIGYTEGKFSYINSSPTQRSLKKFYCIVPDKKK